MFAHHQASSSTAAVRRAGRALGGDWPSPDDESDASNAPETKGLVVVDFGAEWCKPCQHVKPLFEALSANSAYKSVTFLSIDADENPVIVGENSISAFPTFKFFKNSAEEDLPIIGADINEVEAKIKELKRKHEQKIKDIEDDYSEEIKDEEDKIRRDRKARPRRSLVSSCLFGAMAVLG